MSDLFLIPNDEFDWVIRQVQSQDPDYQVTVDRDNDRLWLRYDFTSCDPKDQWDVYLGVKNELEELGLAIDDPQVEHDCISGDLYYIRQQ